MCSKCLKTFGRCRERRKKRYSIVQLLCVHCTSIETQNHYFLFSHSCYSYLHPFNWFYFSPLFIAYSFRQLGRLIYKYMFCSVFRDVDFLIAVACFSISANWWLRMSFSMVQFCVPRWKVCANIASERLFCLWCEIIWRKRIYFTPFFLFFFFFSQYFVVYFSEENRIHKKWRKKKTRADRKFVIM